MDRVQCSGDRELAHQLQQEEDRKRKSEESRQEREEFQKLQVQKLITVLLSRVLISQIYFIGVYLCLRYDSTIKRLKLTAQKIST